jgi:UDP-N-acetylmuramyl pentapeptide phosphotransferase/UDP-N-acetylglucosamine-1-phosphate transferase
VSDPIGFGVAFAVAALASSAATWIARSVAARAGLADDPAQAPDRKRQARPVPAVGGIAILAGLAAARALPAFAWVGVGLAFLVGAVDDRRKGGLPPSALLLGQLVVAAGLVAAGWRLCDGPPALAVAASGFAVVLAINASNTFDNADGATSAIGVLGLGAGSPLLAAPIAGFLPWNLLAAGGTRPAAYLGNAGSFVVGVLLVLDPVGRFALLLPLLDLARLAFVRTFAGSRPWIGDRRHLAHRLQAKGLATLPVVLVLILVAAPAVIGARLGGERALYGCIATLALFVVAVLRTPSVE